MRTNSMGALKAMLGAALLGAVMAILSNHQDRAEDANCEESPRGRADLATRCLQNG